MESLREKLEWVKQPLSELRVVSDGGRIAVHLAGQKMEAISGQILFDFDAGELGGDQELPGAQAQSQPHARIRGLVSERAGTRGDRRAGGGCGRRLPEGAGDSTPEPPALWSTWGRFTTACASSRRPRSTTWRAIEADPGYPLAQFNLGNLYDEQGRLPEALEYYRRALALNPHYADAHFNLALLCERQGDTMKAVHHWKAYLKLDSSGQWADIARRQLERLRQAVLR